MELPSRTISFFMAEVSLSVYKSQWYSARASPAVRLSKKKPKYLKKNKIARLEAKLRKTHSFFRLAEVSLSVYKSQWYSISAFPPPGKKTHLFFRTSL